MVSGLRGWRILDQFKDGETESEGESKPSSCPTQLQKTAFHGLRQVCGQTQHSGRSSRPDWDRNEAYYVQCSAESAAHSGCGKGP